MSLPKPRDHVGAKLLREFKQLRRIPIGGGTCPLVFNSVALHAARLQVVGVILAILAQDKRQGRDGADMLQRPLGPVPRGVEEDSAELQGRVVGNAKPPIGREAASSRVLQIAIDDGEQARDLLAARLMRPQLAVSEPFSQAHPRLRSGTAWEP